jgi:hypothetical protein
MDPYIFQGVVLPERAQIDYTQEFEFTHPVSSLTGKCRVSVIKNQVTVWIDGDSVWDIFDLRNVVWEIVRRQIDMVGYIKGYAYDLEITRVINRGHNIDVVFGIEIRCLEERGKSLDLQAEMQKLIVRSSGENGTLIARCMRDLISAMKDSNDSAFYCYRAIESLKNHCAIVNSLTMTNDRAQWDRFRETAGCDKDMLMGIKEQADPVRHGSNAGLTGEQREKLFLTTWGIVDNYLSAD